MTIVAHAAFRFGSLVGKADLVSILVKIETHAYLSPTAIRRDAKKFQRLFLEFAAVHSGKCQFKRTSTSQKQRQ
ncbi:hypothetical protein FAA86_10635 [Rhizobium rosettiformans W3]|uniref:Uncharacterized protein n=1 Tax=Rhizobium rosettiformans W3 TaxID=538378 RepID=A0A4S8Q323_9HYPH|nr:hypothetical protein FAA86_10635 [Rhizobium rosettiformans W3]